MTRVEAVQKLLQLCSQHIEDQLLNVAPTSLAHLQVSHSSSTYTLSSVKGSPFQGTTCVSLIEEILERTRNEGTSVDCALSPLQKKARKEDSFI